jgi:hypothetical protein
VTIEHGSLEVTADVEEVVRREELVELVERVLKIQRLAFADNETDVRFAGNR